MPKKSESYDFTPAEVRAIRAMKDPNGVQKFLNSLPYHLAPTCWSPRKVLRERTVHCLEGAIFGAAALRVLGFPPLLWDLEAERDTDHVLAVFRQNGCWGAVAASNFAGCRYREPVYRTLRELAMSYFNLYFNLAKQRSLRRYSNPVKLERFDHLHWMTSEKDIWFIPNYLCDIPHKPLLTPKQIKGLHAVDQRLYDAELVGHRWK
jgi:hypothetical protein